MRRIKTLKSDWALGAALLFGAARFLSLAGATAFVDEQAGLLTGWLLARGWRLYGEIFSHHLPFEFLPAQLAAWAAGPEAAAGRVLALLVWAAACVGIHGALRKKGPGLEWTGPGFALFSACWAPLWWGHLLLVELYWSLALAVLIALWAVPLGARREPLGIGGAAAAGFLGALAVTASLPAVLPTAIVLVGMGLAGRLRRRARPFFAGAGGLLLLLGVWGLWNIRWGGLFEQGIVFNFRHYARFAGFDSAGDLYLRQGMEILLHWSGFGPRSWRGVEPLLSVASVGICVFLWRGRGARWGLGALFLFVFARFAAEAPGLEGAPLFHASAYYVLAVLALARGVAWLAHKRGAAAALAAVLLAAGSWPVWRARPEKTLPREKAEVARLVRAITAPEDRVLALPSYPRFYARSRRLPGISHLLYLPWTAEADEAGVLEELERVRPVVVFMENGSIGGHRWEDYGRPVIEWVRLNYAPFRLKTPYGGRLAGRADGPVWENGIYILREREGEIVARVRATGLGRP